MSVVNRRLSCHLIGWPSHHHPFKRRAVFSDLLSRPNPTSARSSAWMHWNVFPPVFLLYPLPWYPRSQGLPVRPTTLPEGRAFGRLERGCCASQSPSRRQLPPFNPVFRWRFVITALPEVAGSLLAAHRQRHHPALFRPFRQRKPLVPLFATIVQVAMPIHAWSQTTLAVRTPEAPALSNSGRSIPILPDSTVIHVSRQDRAMKVSWLKVWSHVTKGIYRSVGAIRESKERDALKNLFFPMGRAAKWCSRCISKAIKASCWRRTDNTFWDNCRRPLRKAAAAVKQPRPVLRIIEMRPKTEGRQIVGNEYRTFCASPNFEGRDNGMKMKM